VLEVIIARHALWSGPSKIEQADRTACDNFTLDKESPIQVPHRRCRPAAHETC
jgi:hypothetical protein